MRRPVSVVAVAIVVLLACSTIAGAARSSQRVIKLLSKTTSTNVVRDKRPSGASAGDAIAGGSLLRNAVPQFGKGKGAIVGGDRWRIVLNSATAGVMTVTVKLPGGTISAQGTISVSRDTVTLRIKGGSGAYARANGVCSGTKAPTNAFGADSLNTYRLTVPA